MTAKTILGSMLAGYWRLESYSNNWLCQSRCGHHVSQNHRHGRIDKNTNAQARRLQSFGWHSRLESNNGASASVCPRRLSRAGSRRRRRVSRCRLLLLRGSLLCPPPPPPPPDAAPPVAEAAPFTSTALRYRKSRWNSGRGGGNLFPSGDQLPNWITRIHLVAASIIRYLRASVYRCPHCFNFIGTCVLLTSPKFNYRLNLEKKEFFFNLKFVIIGLLYRFFFYFIYLLTTKNNQKIIILLWFFVFLALFLFKLFY